VIRSGLVATLRSVPGTARPVWPNAQYRRFMRHFGTKGEGKAISAVAHSLAVIIWHVLKEGSRYEEMGADYFARRTDAEARKR
jgi:transposase